MAISSRRSGEIGKKSLPIKWRDHTWRPLIVIRRVISRINAQPIQQCEPRFFDWVAVPRVVSWSRAGRRLPGGARWVSSEAMPPQSRTRFPNSWRSNNPI